MTHVDEPLDDGAQVIELRPGHDAIDEQRPLKTGERPSFCPHHHTVLDAEPRRVTCDDCGREVDAFDVLHEIARGWERFNEGRREAERRSEVAQANLDELLRAERNAKARRRKQLNDEPEALRHLRAVLKYARRTSGTGPITAAFDYLHGLDDREV
jgi:hypothetical protein